MSYLLSFGGGQEFPGLGVGFQHADRGLDVEAVLLNRRLDGREVGGHRVETCLVVRHDFQHSHLVSRQSVDNCAEPVVVAGHDGVVVAELLELGLHLVDAGLGDFGPHVGAELLPIGEGGLHHLDPRLRIELAVASVELVSLGEHVDDQLLLVGTQLLGLEEGGHAVQDSGDGGDRPDVADNHVPELGHGLRPELLELCRGVGLDQSRLSDVEEAVGPSLLSEGEEAGDLHLLVEADIGVSQLLDGDRRDGEGDGGHQNDGQQDDETLLHRYSLGSVPFLALFSGVGLP